MHDARRAIRRPPAGLLGLLLLALGAPAAADTRVNVGSLSADGVEVRALSCALTKGGLLGSVMVVGSLAKQKKAFDACAPEGAAFAVEFTWAGGRTTAARVTGSSAPKRHGCMSAALTRIKPSVEGTCSAVLLVGKAEAARQAADALAPAAREEPGTQLTGQPDEPPQGKPESRPPARPDGKPNGKPAGKPDDQQPIRRPPLPPT